MLPYWKDSFDQAQKAARQQAARKRRVQRERQGGKTAERLVGAGPQDEDDDQFELTVGTETVGGEQAQVVERRATVRDSDDPSEGRESEDEYMSDGEHDIGGIGTTRQLAEYRAHSLGDEETAHKIREGHFTEQELVAMLEKENDDLVDFVQGRLAGQPLSDDGRNDTLSANALSAGLVGRYND